MGTRYSSPGLSARRRVCRSLGDDFGQACGLGVVGEVHLADGRLHQARACLEDALGQWTAMRAELFRARTLRTLAEVHDALGDAEAARAMTAEAMETFRTHGAREYQELRVSRSVAGRD